jgi:hypothetical protein
MPETTSWKPKCIRRVANAIPSGTSVVEVVTDAGAGYVKFLGNREGPHVLAAEYVGTRLAAELGLPTLDWSLFEYDGIPEITLKPCGKALPGTAWSTRKVEGFIWSGESKDLDVIENQEDLAKLVLLDQWTLNCDRYRPLPPPPRINYGNVFFSRESIQSSKLRLLAIDHSHIFTCGNPLRPDMARIDKVRDHTAFGVFPHFTSKMKRQDTQAAVDAMNRVSMDTIRAIVTDIPTDWEVSDEIRRVMIEFLSDRRNWLSARFTSSLFPQNELF